MANTPDNRKSKRSPVTLRIKFKSANLEQFIERYAVDVSQGGIFIRTKEPLPVGTTMRFEFQLRDESPLITGEGTVVWIREQNASQAGVAPGMGVRFDRLTEPSQAVLDEILAYKAARGANGIATAVGEMPTRVVAAGPRGDGPAPMPFAGEGVPEEAFEQATKVHSLEELAELSARPDAGSPGPRNTGGAAPTERYPAGFDPVTDYADDDKTKVYPALARPGGRQAGPNLDLGAPGSTQRLPPAPAVGADVELGHAGYDEEEDDDELPFDTRDVELGLAGPTAQLAQERLSRPDDVELGHAGVTQPLTQAPNVRPASRAASAAGPARAQVQARVSPIGDLGDLGESGASDPLSDVPLPEAGHFDLGQAGPTMQLKAERLGRDAELELGAAGSNEDAEVITAALPAVPGKDRNDQAQRPVQPAALASAAAAARAPASPDPEAREETQERASDELAPRRVARQDSELLAAGAAHAEAAEAEADDEPVESDEPAAAAPPAFAEERASGSAPILRVSTRNGTEKVPVNKGLPAGLLVAVAALILLVGAGALYLFMRDRAPGPETVEAPAPAAEAPAPSPDTPSTPPVPDQPSTNPDTPAAAAPDAAVAAAAPEVEPEIEPEIEIEPDQPATPVETVQLEVRSVPPGATAALIDGAESGPTPMKFTLDKSKKHRVRVSLPGYVSQEIELDPARRQPKRVVLAPTPWILRFESTPPEAFVYVDGRRVVGETPNEFRLPKGWEKKKHLKVSFRLPHHEKLDIIIDPAFTAEGEAMVQSVQGTLVPGEPAPHRPAPSRTGNQPAPGGQATPPAGGQGEGSGAAKPAPAEAEPAEAEPPKPEPPAPEGQSADPPAQPS